MQRTRRPSARPPESPETSGGPFHLDRVMAPPSRPADWLRATSGSGRRHHRPLSAMVVCAATGITIMVTSAPASAHAALESITPGNESVQTAPPREVKLTFNEPVNRRFTVIRVTGPAGASVGSGAPTVDRDVVRQPLVPLSQPGRYKVAYRTVSVDGHIVSGSREFTFRPDAATTPKASVQAVPPAIPVAAGAPQQESSGFLWTQLALGGVIVALLSGAVLTIRRAYQRDG